MRISVSVLSTASSKISDEPNKCKGACGALVPIPTEPPSNVATALEPLCVTATAGLVLFASTSTYQHQSDLYPEW